MSSVSAFENGTSKADPVHPVVHGRHEFVSALFREFLEPMCSASFISQIYQPDLSASSISQIYQPDLWRRHFFVAPVTHRAWIEVRSRV